MTTKKSGKGKGKVAQMLSPENYIKEKARSLPIYECLLNSNWKEVNMANIIIARKHSNGNLTGGLFLVDMGALGVKDSFTFFNVTPSDYNERKSSFSGHYDSILIDYTLAHNIVYGAIEYADDLGFKPHKDFTRLSRFILNEDTDDIEYIEIEFGLNGKPCYTQSHFDDDIKVKQILAQLERKCGAGNYDFILDATNEFGEDDDEFDEYDDDEINALHEELIDLLNKIKKLKKDEMERVAEIVGVLFGQLIDFENIEHYTDDFKNVFYFNVVNDVCHNGLLGLTPTDTSLSTKMHKQFLKLFEMHEYCHNKPKKVSKSLNSFSKEWGIECAAYCFLELYLADNKSSCEFKEKLENYVTQFPNYKLLQILYLMHKIENNDITHEELEPYVNSNLIFNNLESIHQYEFVFFVTFLFSAFSFLNDPTRLAALGKFLYNSKFINYIDRNTSMALFHTKMNFVLDDDDYDRILDIF